MDLIFEELATWTTHGFTRQLRPQPFEKCGGPAYFSASLTSWDSWLTDGNLGAVRTDIVIYSPAVAAAQLSSLKSEPFNRFMGAGLLRPRSLSAKL